MKSHYVAIAGLELAYVGQMASNPESSLPLLPKEKELGLKSCTTMPDIYCVGKPKKTKQKLIGSPG